MSRRPSILCAAFSARQIAASARRAGYDALAIDFFHDLDLETHAFRARSMGAHYPAGFDGEALLEALDDIAHGLAPIGFVYGAGFEDRPDLVEKIARRWPVLGTSAQALRAVKDPATFATTCRAAGIAHPEICFAAPGEPAGWLSKEIGGAGGSHVRAAEPGEAAAGRYFQRFVSGERWSAAFLAAGREGFVLGFTRQWTDPSPTEPFRYGGAVGPLEPPEPGGAAMRENIADFLQELPLKGLCSADFVLAPDGTPWLLEINPRFGATLDIFDTEAEPLLALHLAACSGTLPERWRGPATIRAAGLAWAGEPAELAPGFAWPPWTADRSRPPGHFPPGAPLCTVLAEGDTPAAALDLFHARAARIRASLERSAA